MRPRTPGTTRPTQAVLEAAPPGLTLPHHVVVLGGVLGALDVRDLAVGGQRQDAGVVADLAVAQRANLRAGRMVTGCVSRAAAGVEARPASGVLCSRGRACAALAGLFSFFRLPAQQISSMRPAPTWYSITSRGCDAPRMTMTLAKRAGMGPVPSSQASASFFLGWR